MANLAAYQQIGDLLINRTDALSPIPRNGSLLPALNDPNKSRPDFPLELSGLLDILNAIAGADVGDFVGKVLSALKSLDPLKAAGIVIQGAERFPVIFEGFLQHQLELAASLISILRALNPQHVNDVTAAVNQAYGDYFFGDGVKILPDRTLSPPELPGITSNVEQIAALFSQKTGERYVRDLISIAIEAIGNRQFTDPAGHDLPTRLALMSNASQIQDKIKANKWFAGFSNLAEAAVTAAVEQATQGAAAFSTSPLIAASVATAAGTAARKATQDTFLSELGI